MKYIFTDWVKLSPKHNAVYVRYVWDYTQLVGSFLILQNNFKYTVRFNLFLDSNKEFEILKTIFNFDSSILYSSEEEAKVIIDKYLLRFNNLIPFI